MVKRTVGGSSLRNSSKRICFSTMTTCLLTTQQFLASKNMTVVPHPPYLPDLALSDFLFPKMKGKQFSNINEIQAASYTIQNTNEKLLQGFPVVGMALGLAFTHQWIPPPQRWRRRRITCRTSSQFFFNKFCIAPCTEYKHFFFMKYRYIYI